MLAEPSGLPPDRGIEHVIPLEPDAQPPFKRMYRLSPSELIEVKRQVCHLKYLRGNGNRAAAEATY